MDLEYTAIVKQQGHWWIGWIEEVPGVNCQERSREELLESLRITLQEAIEFNRQETIASAGATESLAVGGESFVKEIRELLGGQDHRPFDNQGW